VHWIDKQWHGHTVVCKRFFLVRPGLANLPNTGSPGTTADMLKNFLSLPPTHIGAFYLME